ncbi:lysine-specific demethylase lid [Coccinella septempunctata]|uniref:lysine-specific demethylase lid n=1 Tax=Coccinella septempunctata TaxID=41139 RepID=UPI001D061576|nr:lysine-specific demethylase lid [Coccinella septempunctata]
MATSKEKMTGMKISPSCSKTEGYKIEADQLFKDEGFEFTVPPEVPVFHPTEEEFADPLAYIGKIRPIAENTGICKIKPPPNWQPPFAVDVDKLRFTPRIQRLNELEAKTRIKLNFLDQIAKFWELQGSSLKIPMVEKRALDLYTLHRVVQLEGGFETASRERKWSKIAIRLGYPPGKSIGTILKQHYERLLYPFDVFKQGKTMEIKVDPDVPERNEKTDKDYKPHGIVGRMAIKPPCEKARRSKRFENQNNDEEKPKTEDDDDDDDADSKELKRLQIHGAGPKMAGYNDKKKRSKNFNADFDPLAKYVCHNCSRGDSEEFMLLCDGCDDSYHTFCLMPPLSDVPKGDWRCPKCVAEEVSKPMEAFGFEQAQREYTLQQFGEMADQFKSDYFNMPVHMVPLPMVEKEFWRIVSSIDEDVTVEYGADLHTMDHGSGFPTKTSINLYPGDKEYADSGWNLNNLPVLEGSVLGYINADISGMKVPWMYVGMCFATFCWHNEDHWSYSINYLHWGEAKTWYGVPGSKAELFEETMKSAAPELFHSQPDLLHQLVTIMNPNVLMNAGVPVYRTDQCAGEFVVTFPRAYHAGFNQGYNFAEAVNFAPADWLRMGRECILHYSHLRRFCVFSHDELVCKMALVPDKLDITIAAATYQDMLHMVDTEKKLRKNLLEWGVTNAEREAFELLPDDERQCEICKTTCFLSALTCTCTNVLVCLRHFEDLCKCNPAAHTLRYRYTLDELPVMLKGLKLKAESFDHWVNRVKDALDPNTPKTLSLTELKALLNEANGKKFPKSDLLQTLTNAVVDAEKCASVIHQLDLNKIRTRTRNSTDNKYKLTIEELTLFCEELDSLACHLDESKNIKMLLQQTKAFEKESKRLLNSKLSECVLLELENCYSLGNSLCIELPALKQIAVRIKQAAWLKDVLSYKKRSEVLAIDSINSLIKGGMDLPPHPEMEEELGVLQGLLIASQEWETKAQAVLKDKGNDVLIEVDKLLAEAAAINAYLPTEEYLFDAINKARDWLRLQEDMNSAEYYPYYEDMEELVKKGRALPLYLVEVNRLASYLESAYLWKEKTSRVFLRKNSSITLLEALSPRNNINPPKQKKKGGDGPDPLEGADPNSFVTVFKQAEETEMDLIKNFRKENSVKSLDPNDCASFCTCQRGAFGLMMQCELCKDWFHSVCVQLPKIATTSFKGNFTMAAMHFGFKDCKFLCPNCCRTKRPRLDVILGLLMSLQKLYCRLPEGEALQCLTERAMNWQDRARNLLQNPQLEVAKTMLSNFNKRYMEAAAKQRTEEIISCELKKACKNPDLQQKVTEIANKSGVVNTLQESSAESDDSKECTSSSLQEDHIDEHAYSLHLPKINEDEFRVNISAELHQQITELLMEGDLLEVHLDETLQLWKLVQSTRNPEKEPILIDFDQQSLSTPVKRGRKRRSEECEAARKLKSVKSNFAKKPGEKKVREKREKPGRKKQSEKSKQKKSTESDEDEDDDYATCAAANCQVPTGNVDWVQCDGGCELWFHMACVGLSAGDINEDEDYICMLCSQAFENINTNESSRSNSPPSPDSTQPSTSKESN